MWPTNELIFGDLAEPGQLKRPLDAAAENVGSKAKRAYTDTLAEQNFADAWVSSHNILQSVPQNSAKYYNTPSSTESGSWFDASLEGWAFESLTDQQQLTQSLCHEQHTAWDQNGALAEGLVSSNYTSSHTSLLFVNSCEALSVEVEPMSKAFGPAIANDGLNADAYQGQESEEGTPSHLVHDSTRETPSQQDLDTNTCDTAPTSECSGSPMAMHGIQMGRVA